MKTWPFEKSRQNVVRHKLQQKKRESSMKFAIFTSFACALMTLAKVESIWPIYNTHHLETPHRLLFHALMHVSTFASVGQEFNGFTACPHPHFSRNHWCKQCKNEHEALEFSMKRKRKTGNISVFVYLTVEIWNGIASASGLF